MLSPNSILQNRYRIVRRLGEGGMGTVYEAIDQRVSCVVALKETLLGREVGTHQAFEHEAALLANLRHPSLPKVMDYFSENDGEFLVMEFIPGHDLAELLELRNGPFPQSQVLKWADDLLNVLEHLHSLSPPILHRDIKPANLKLTKRGEVFLLDFGLAKGAAGQMPTLQTSKSVRGYTPIYSPLEQIHGQGTDQRSDIYALGASLYHLLTGKPPTDAPTRFVAVDEDQPDPLKPVHEVNPEIDGAVSNAIRQAMAIRRRSRFSSATAMRGALLGKRVELGGPSPVNIEWSQSDQSDKEFLDATEKFAEPKEETKKERPTQTNENNNEGKREDLAQTAPAQHVFDLALHSTTPAPIEDATLIHIPGQRQVTADTPSDQTTDPVSAKTEFAQDHDDDPRAELSEGKIAPIKTIHAAYPIVSSSPIASNDSSITLDEPHQVKPKHYRKLLIGSVALALIALVAVVSAVLLWRLKTNSGVAVSNTSPSLESAKNVGPSKSMPAGIQAPTGMVYVPGGEFMMGRDDGDEYERPAHQVTVKPFFIDITEVTNQQYEEFVKKTAHAPPTGWQGKDFPSGRARWPVTNITWYDAVAYATWSGKRLPTEAEWELAARGTDGRKYPWGDKWEAGLANATQANKSLTDVGTYKGTSPFGLADMVGNAWEWTSDKLSPYPGGHIDASTTGNEMRIIRGGSYQSDEKTATTTYRRGYPAKGNFDRASTGFRCVKDLD